MIVEAVNRWCVLQAVFKLVVVALLFLFMLRVLVVALQGRPVV